MILSAKYSPPGKIGSDVVACLMFEDQDLFRKGAGTLASIDGAITHALKSSAFKGQSGDSMTWYPKKRTVRCLVTVGLGKRRNLSLESLRKAGARCAGAARNLKGTSLAILEPDEKALKSSGITPESAATALVEGAVLSSYRFDRYITEKKSQQTLRKLEVVSESQPRTRKIRDGVKLAGILCDGTCLARDLSNAPGNEIYPQTLAQRAVQAGKKSGFKVTIFNESRIKSLKMGGLLGVAQGSIHPPRFIIMEHRTRKKNTPTVVLVGKGVTFDAGGISIKPSQGMGEMKMDMSGAAAVIGAMFCVAKLKLPLNVIGLVPAAENLLGEAAMRPGDILTHYNGKTSEIDNTDAEGRLILADALSYASDYKPDLVIDLATLTGACVVALGQAASGMMGNHQKSMDRLSEAGERTYERVWQLPLFEEYERQIRSNVADVKNVGGRWAGAITAALFLKKFIGKYNWIHLDIAGTAIIEEGHGYIPKGGSGVGVRLLADFLRNWKKN